MRGNPESLGSEKRERRLAGSICQITFIGKYENRWAKQTTIAVKFDQPLNSMMVQYPFRYGSCVLYLMSASGLANNNHVASPRRKTITAQELIRPSIDSRSRQPGDEQKGSTVRQYLFA